MPQSERLSLRDAEGREFAPACTITEEQVEELAALRLIVKLGRRRVYAVRCAPGETLDSIHAALRRKISRQLPIAEDCRTVARDGWSGYRHIHTAAWDPQLAV